MRTVLPALLICFLSPTVAWSQENPLSTFHAYDGMTDASAPLIVKLDGSDTPKLGVLTASNMQDLEHDGNRVTYMRIKNIVPPTSEPGFLPVPEAKK